MIGLDTNVIIRYAMRDDEKQTFLADQLIDGLTPESPGYLSQVILAETWWVLTRRYQLTPAEVSTFIRQLLESSTLISQNPDLTYIALRAVDKQGADFANALAAAISQSDGRSEMMTFDAKAAKRAGMTLLR
ncbi:MAG: PIN domain-containing protein [Promicromonosporaceae bacterium]|nr:PIN domain-containing protein [Promicromonosporaceae bacterium]